jgi:hypothetical protein
MKSIYASIMLLFSSLTLFAQNNINFSVSDNWIGYMNVFQLPANGSGYMFGSSWGISDLQSTFDTTNNTLTLQPNFNTYRDNPNDVYWVDTTTGAGNKFMEASTFVEPGATFQQNQLTFSGTVISNTLDTNYTAKFFIKALDPNNNYLDALNGTKTFVLPASGNFTVTASATDLAAGLIVQYGFVVTGANANPADEQALGSVVIGSASATSVNLVQEGEITVYPNPANEILFISSANAIESYNVYNVLGTLVQSGNNTNAINIADFKAGTYYLEVVQNGKRIVKSFVKM